MNVEVNADLIASHIGQDTYLLLGLVGDALRERIAQKFCALHQEQKNAVTTCLNISPDVQTGHVDSHVSDHVPTTSAASTSSRRAKDT